MLRWGKMPPTAANGGKPLKQSLENKKEEEMPIEARGNLVTAASGVNMGLGRTQESSRVLREEGKEMAVWWQERPSTERAIPH